jgi:hypothetical protein
MSGLESTPIRAEKPVFPRRLDAAEIAQGVRQIAHELYQMLMRTAWNPVELLDLKRRIDELRVHTHGTGLIAIDRWLESCRSSLESRFLTCTCAIENEYNVARLCPKCSSSC